MLNLEKKKIDIYIDIESDRQQALQYACSVSEH